jgi:acyl-CoA thioesterase-1
MIAVLSMAALTACSAGDAPADSGSPPDSAIPADAASRGDDVAYRAVVFLGTSLTAGYGVGADAAFPAVIAQRIRADSLPFRVINAGISGETSAGGLRRIDWLLQNPVDVLVLELGANDGLRGLDADSMRSNLRAILERTRSKYPDAAIVIAGMEAPPNLGAAYTSRFRDVYTDIADEFDATLVPFLLAGVAGVPALNQEDGIHPNVEGHRRVADNVWPVLRTVLDSLAAVRQ